MSQALSIYCDAAALQALEASFRQASEAGRQELQLALAWQLRQRDPLRAQALVDRIDAPPGSAALARLDLVRAELAYLDNDPKPAWQALGRAERGFAGVGDPLGLGDCAWLAAYLAHAAGDSGARDEALGRAEAHWRVEADEVRLDVVRSVQLFLLAFGRPSAAQQAYASRGPACGHAYAQGWRDIAAGQIAASSGQPGQAAALLAQAAFRLSESGHLEVAAMAAGICSESLAALNDLAAALEWAEHAQGFARRAGARRRAAMTAAQLGELLRRSQRPEEARRQLDFALEVLASSRSHLYGAALLFRAELALEMGERELALAHVEQAESTLRALGTQENVVGALVLGACVLDALGRPAQARTKLSAALALAQQLDHGPLKVKTLRALADQHRRHALQHPPHAHGGGTAMEYLQQAYALAQTIEGFRPPPQLLTELADACAASGDPVRACALLREAAAARELVFSEEFAQRAAALQVRHELERRQVELEHERLLAAAQIASLQAANATLQQLGEIGRELAGQLEADAIFRTLGQHVGALLQSQFLAVFVAQPGTGRLRRHPSSAPSCWPDELALDAPSNALAQCGREGRPLYRQRAVGALAADWIPATPGMRSAAFYPLQTGNCLVGVLCLQAERLDAFGERERGVLASLVASCSIALANAASMAKLKQAQSQIAQQEKMASLGQLVASVAHELNTPISAIRASGQVVCEALDRALQLLLPLVRRLDEPQASAFLQLLSHLHGSHPPMSSREERALKRELQRRLVELGVAQAERRSARLLECRATPPLLAGLLPLLVSEHCDALLDVGFGLASAIGNAHNIAQATGAVTRLVSALKTYSRQGNAALRPTVLAHGLDTVLTLFQNKLKRGVSLVRNFAELPPAWGDPDGLNQVWTNLIHNALQAMDFEGTLTVSLRQEGPVAVVEIADTGPGVPVDLRAQIFEPFFTTKPLGEGCGLGLGIVRSTVERHGGSVTVGGGPGAGAVFRVTLPLCEAAAG